MTELLPCPFCGGEAEVCESGINGKMQVYGLVEHKDGCFFLADGLPTKYQHIMESEFDAWNSRATGGTLTAEQVRTAIFNGSSYASYDGAKYYADGISMQAIADELNAKLNTRAERTCDYKQAAEYWQRMYEQTFAERTCKQEERGWGTEGDHARVWLTCGHDCMVPTVQDLPNYCPNCGAKVVEE